MINHDSLEERLKIAGENPRLARASFQQLVENNPFGVYIVDADMTLRYVSRGAERLFSQFEPMIGHDFETIMHTIWPQGFAAEIMQHFRHTLETGEPYRAPTFVEHRHDTQQRESYEWQLQRLVLPDGRHGVVCYFYDATQRELEVEFTRRREQYFREMADAAPAMVWVASADDKRTFLSRGWQDFTGLPQEEGLGMGWLEMVHPADREQSAESILSAIERREAFAHDYRLRTTDGSYRWVVDSGRPKFDADGSFQGFVGSVIDIHDRRLAEDELRERAREIEEGERRLRMAAETAGFGTYDYNFETGALIWSEELYRIYGLPFDQLPDPNRVVSLVHPDDRQRFLQMVAAASSSSGSERHCAEFRIVRPDGAIRWVLDTGRAFCESLNKDRHVTRVLGTVQDITDRKLFEESLTQAKHSAELANRSRGEFLANMSHEIRTPMTAILGHADILKDYLKDPDNLQLVQTIRRNGQYLLHIINDILDLSKIDAGKMEMDRHTIRPDAIVREVQSLMDVRASEKGLPLRTEFAGPIPASIETDGVRLRQVLLNLVGNAIKFTKEGEVKLVVHYEQAQRRLAFDVIDTGIGIAEDKVDLLFEPFRQVDNSSTRLIGGTGLGLAICRRLAHMLGGEIEVESELGRGSKFKLVLNVTGEGPLIQPELKTSSIADSYKEDVRLSAWVLVVDDRRDIRYLAQHYIERAGGTVFIATNGQEAIEILSAPDAPEIDLILMDMQMPVMDGYAATAELRRRGCELPIIALTANAVKSDREECLAAGCTDYTTKPLDHRQLIRMIAKLTAE